MDDTKWIILDTETDGLRAPIHVVEIAAQLMCGREPCGEPFQIFLNHDVFIPPGAVAVHGYTQEFLREHGRPPLEAHESFKEYAKDYPIVAHNLGYDWNCALAPEWARLGVAPIGRRGFCTVTLSRRVLTESLHYSLDALRMQFDLLDGPSHRALADVGTVVRLFREILLPRLEIAGLTTYEAWEQFSRRTPVSECWRTINPSMESRPKYDAIDSWKQAGTLWWAINDSGRYSLAWCKRIDLQGALLKIDPVHWDEDLDHLLPLILAQLPAENCEREKATRI
jgi:DNA polymerase III epsilon subunit-like protein